ncbi:MAG: class I SAM-dependent methyltransferase [Candidatus Micrarchaeota archaeon]|nr:class I SAM-dependent methyltransferase [Candidatus Micrarchaeota archaeon]
MGKINTRERSFGKSGDVPELIKLKNKIEREGLGKVPHFKHFPGGLVIPPEISARRLQEIHKIEVPGQADAVLKRLERLNSSWAIKEKDLSYDERKVWMPNKEMRLWQIPRRTGLFLYWITNQTKSTEILELGTSAGYSAMWQALGAKPNNGVVYTADMSMLKIGMASKNFRAAGVDNIVQLHGTIAEVLSSWHRPVDLIFLDADKKNYASYLEMALPKLKVGGYVVADNAVDFMELMSSLIGALRDGAINGFKLHSYVLGLDNGIYIIRKGEPIDNKMITSFFNAQMDSF